MRRIRPEEKEEFDRLVRELLKDYYTGERGINSWFLVPTKGGLTLDVVIIGEKVERNVLYWVYCRFHDTNKEVRQHFPNAMVGGHCFHCISDTGDVKEVFEKFKTHIGL